jgi:membrane-associated phospholipid phosphatase
MRARSQLALLGAAAFAVAGALVGVLAFDWPLARSHDATSVLAFESLTANARLDHVVTWIAHRASPFAYVLAVAVFVAVALLRRLPRLALAIPVAMTGAYGTSLLLKQLISQTRHAAVLEHNQLTGPSFPSGHATGAMSVALCAVLIAPPLLRPLAGLLGCALSLAVGYSVLVLGWHYPSDVIGGFLVAGAWVSLVLGVLWRMQRRRVASRRGLGRRSTSTRAALLPAALAAIALAALIAIANVAPSRARVDGSLMMGAGVVAGLAVAMTAGLVVALRPRVVRRRETDTAPSHSLPATSSQSAGG